MDNSFQSIASSSVTITISRAVLKVFGAVAVFLTLRELTMVEYGTVSLALSVSGPVLALSGLGLDDLVMAAGARARGENAFQKFLPLYAGFSYFKILSTMVLVAGSFWLRQFFDANQQLLINTFFLPLSIWIAIVSFRGLIDSTLQMLEKFKVFAQASVAEQAVRLVIVLGLFFFHQITLANVIWSYVIAKCIATLFLFPFVVRTFPFVPLGQAFSAYFHFIRKKAFWETARSVFGNLLSSVDQWMVGLMLGLESVGILSFAVTLNSLLAQVLPFKQVLYPFMARLSPDKEASSSVARRMSKYSVWGSLLIMLGAAMVFPIVLPFILPAYVPAIPLFLFLSLSQLMTGVSASHGSLMYAFQEQKYMFAISWVNTISALTLLPLCIFFFGVYGAVLERHLSSSLIIWLREHRLRKKHHVTTYWLPDMIQFDRFDRTTLQRFFGYVRDGWSAKFKRV